MSFSIGDLITFVVVLLILVIFRALDRNNRSLEKLKRFSDKITENLSALVEREDRAGAGPVSRAAGEPEDGQGDARPGTGRGGAAPGQDGGIEEIQNRFAEYDKALTELTAMSARVDKNLLRIKDESEFVDAVRPQDRGILEAPGAHGEADPRARSRASRFAPGRSWQRRAGR